MTPGSIVTFDDFFGRPIFELGPDGVFYRRAREDEVFLFVGIDHKTLLCEKSDDYVYVVLFDFSQGELVSTRQRYLKSAP